MKEVISQEVIEGFLNGGDDEMYIVGVEYDYPTNTIYKIIQDPEKGKIVKSDSFTPFMWVGDLSGLGFYNNSKSIQKKRMGEFGILIEKLDTHGDERLESGMKYLVKSLKSYTDLISFFRMGGINPWDEKYRQHFTVLSPVEQYLIQTKKRLFKGIDEYSGVNRFVFDIETTGLDPETCVIILIGVKDNRGLNITIPAFGEDGEKKCIERFFQYIRDLKPTIIAGYNSAFFDWPFILKRAQILGVDVDGMTQIFTSQGMKEKEGMLKLANEVEPYKQHVIWGFNIIDIAHSVRRAQAINSEIKSWGLKYITTYLEKEKPNRVYVEGSKISKIYLDNESYYVNPKTGGYKQIGEPGTEDLLKKYPDVSFISCDYKKMNEIDNQVHSIGYVKNDDVLYKKLESFHPHIDYLNNLNYYCLGHGRCFKNLKEIDFKIKDFDAGAEDSYHTMYSNAFGKWLHVPRNLYRWSYRTDSESHSSVKSNFNANFDIGYEECKNNPHEPIYDYNECYKEFNSLIFFDINTLNNISIISPRLSKNQENKIKEVYIDKNIQFNKYSGFEQYAIVLNYFESEDGLCEVLDKLKSLNNKTHIKMYYLNENIHLTNTSRDVFMNEKLNKFLSIINKHFSNFSYYCYFRHLIFTVVY